MGLKTCLNCMHGSKVMNEGAFLNESPQRPYCIICERRGEIGNLDKNEFWNEFKMPKVCGNYEPRMVMHCAYCKELINAEEYLWDIWAGINGRAVCSSDCRAKLEAAEIGSLFYD